METLLSSSPKHLISHAELQSRLDVYLKERLEEDDQSDEAFSILAESPNAGNEKASLTDVYNRHSKKLAEEIQTADNFENWSKTEVFEMLDRGILNPEEISHANFLEITRLLHRYQSIFYKIKSARLNGDFVYEKAFLPTNNVAAPLVIEDQEQPRKKAWI